ncbi:unnamed protein product [Didymodactylos carnosus]|uniref:Uncharacterized protein n=2 Tax=Didymodactylos carnosus TaxID=1234261 RepID=A0A8S2CQJ1_9BILA|nr:unnamed protein product [Didymodactylos carnosus]CAF3533023.1 unnamed protein product [Didymodactylos carnosus]
MNVGLRGGLVADAGSVVVAQGVESGGTGETSDVGTQLNEAESERSIFVVSVVDVVSGGRYDGIKIFVGNGRGKLLAFVVVAEESVGDIGTTLSIIVFGLND